MGGAWENRVCGPGNAHAGIAWKQKAHSLCVLVEGRQLGSVQLESKLRVKRVAVRRKSGEGQTKCWGFLDRWSVLRSANPCGYHRRASAGQLPGLHGSPLNYSLPSSKNRSF